MLNFGFPLSTEYERISSAFGWRWIQLGEMTVPVRQFHPGQDHGCPIGTLGKVAYKGHVSKIWEGYRAGRCLEITHPTCSIPGFLVQTVYYQLNKIYFKYLQQIGSDEIAYETGNSGKWTTGPHLHWGVKVNNRFIDPRICYN